MCPPCLVPGPVTLLRSSRPPGKLFCPWPIPRRWLSPRSLPQGPELLPPTLSARPTVRPRTGVGGDVTGYSGLTTDPARNGQAATRSQISFHKMARHLMLALNSKFNTTRELWAPRDVSVGGPIALSTSREVNTGLPSLLPPHTQHQDGLLTSLFSQTPQNGPHTCPFFFSGPQPEARSSSLHAGVSATSSHGLSLPVPPALTHLFRMCPPDTLLIPPGKGHPRHVHRGPWGDGNRNGLRHLRSYSFSCAEGPGGWWAPWEDQSLLPAGQTLLAAPATPPEHKRTGWGGMWGMEGMGTGCAHVGQLCPSTHRGIRAAQRPGLWTRLWPEAAASMCL